MAEEEIVKINRKFEKMIEKSEVDESIAQDLLSRLQDSRITLNILKKTSIGKTVNNLRRVTSNEQVTTLAKNLLKNWKKLVPESSNGKDTKAAAASSSSSNSQSSQETKTSNTEEKKIQPSKKLERKPSFASSSTLQTLDDFRLKSRDMLAAAFSSAELPEGSADPVELSTRVEDAIFRELKDTGTRYRNRIRSRVSNLKDPKNINLRSDVLLGRITAERLAVLTAEEMASEELKQERLKLNDRAISEYQLAVDEGVGTDLIQCKRCKQNNCAYTEVQTRGADEPMTLFVFCKSCGNRWKM